MTEFIISGLMGCILIGLCSLIVYEMLRFCWARIPTLRSHPRLRVAAMLAAIFSSHIINIWIFGFVYFALYNSGYGGFGGIDVSSGKTVIDIFECIYFSAATYTTLGIGDITPLGSMRMITGVESLTGFLLIGWTVSFSYLAMEKFWVLPHRRGGKK